MDRGIKERLVQLSFSAVFERVSDCGLLYNLRSLGVGRQFLFSDRRQRVRLEVIASVYMVLGVPQVSVLGPLLFILCTCKLSYIIENHIVG